MSQQWPFGAPFPASTDEAQSGSVNNTTNNNTNNTNNRASNPTTELSTDAAVPQLAISFSHSSNNNAQPNMYISPIQPSNGDGPYTTITGSTPLSTPTHQGGSNARAGPGNGWGVNQYAPFPAIREDTQLAQVCFFFLFSTFLITNSSLSLFPFTLCIIFQFSFL